MGPFLYFGPLLRVVVALHPYGVQLQNFGTSWLSSADVVIATIIYGNRADQAR